MNREFTFKMKCHLTCYTFRKVLHLLCIFCYTSILLSCSQAEVRSSEYLSEDANIPAHPRILMNIEAEKAIREILVKDSIWLTVHDRLLHESSRMLSKSVVEFKFNGKSILKVAREARKRISYLSYAWRFTGERKFLDKAEKELLAVSHFKNWNPSHFLDVAELTMAVAIGYDWLYDHLPDSTRRILKEAIVEKGLKTSMDKEYTWWLEENSNWNQVCNAGLAYGALAIIDEEPELVRKIINRSIQSISLAMEAYDPDGGYPEGYMYWGYGTLFNVYLLDALQKIFSNDFGLSDNKGFMKTGSFMLHMVGPSGKNFNFSDGDSKVNHNPAMFWFARHNNDPSILFFERESVRSNLSAHRDLPALLIWGCALSLNSSEVPAQRNWFGKGENPVALMRSDWTSQGLFVGIKGGTAQNGHAHLDAGSFVLDAHGVRWAVDLGGQEYAPVEAMGIDLWSKKQNSDRWKLFRYNNLAHNTLAFDQQFQNVDGHAEIISFVDDSLFSVATVDLSEIYKGQVKEALRSAALINNTFVVVRDVITNSHGPVTLRWTMVTSAEIILLDAKTAKLSMDGKQLILKILEPARGSFSIWPAVPENEYDEPNPGISRLGFEIKMDANEIVTCAVLFHPFGAENFAWQNYKASQNWPSGK